MINKLKKILGLAVLKYIKKGTILGIGTGSTINYFIESLPLVKHNIKGVISSSIQSSMKIKKIGINLLDLNNIDQLHLYIDSADELNNNMQMIKGGGGALTKEKIISEFAQKFICIADYTKMVNILGNFPLPIEVIPLARKLVINKLLNIGGLPIHREGIITENNNIIIDVHNLCIKNPINLEEYINNIPGVVTVGLFAKRSADIVLLSTSNGIHTMCKT